MREEACSAAICATTATLGYASCRDAKGCDYQRDKSIRAVP